MLSSLVHEKQGAIPLTPVATADLAALLPTLDDRARRWVEATGFAAESGKAALLPDGEGGLARVLVGITRGEELWALAGLPDTLPERLYALDPEPAAAEATAMALGWALASYAFTRYKQRPRGFARLVWPNAASRAI